MIVRPAIVGYCPPPTAPGHGQVFYDHILKYRTSVPMLLYSDYAWPDVVKLNGTVETYKTSTFPDGRPNKFGMPNAIFFTGLRIAMLNKYTHALILEHDCRVLGDNWDAPIWEEYFSLDRPVVAAGTLASYNPCAYSPEATRRWQDLVKRNSKRNFPIATWGWHGADNKGPDPHTMIFPNGALAIYDMAWMARMFDLQNVLAWCTRRTAWDFDIGIEIWRRFEEDSYDVVAFLETIFSGFGDTVTSPQERKELLTSGKVTAVHQVKDAWVPE